MWCGSFPPLIPVSPRLHHPGAWYGRAASDLHSGMMQDLLGDDFEMIGGDEGGRIGEKRKNTWFRNIFDYSRNDTLKNKVV